MSKFCLLSTFFAILVLLFVNISAKPKPGGIDIIINNLRPEPQPKFLAASRASPAKNARHNGRRFAAFPAMKKGIDKIRL